MVDFLKQPRIVARYAAEDSRIHDFFLGFSRFKVLFRRFSITTVDY